MPHCNFCSSFAIVIQLSRKSGVAPKVKTTCATIRRCTDDSTNGSSSAILVAMAQAPLPFSRESRLGQLQTDRMQQPLYKAVLLQLSIIV